MDHFDKDIVIVKEQARFESEWEYSCGVSLPEFVTPASVWRVIFCDYVSALSESW